MSKLADLTARQIFMLFWPFVALFVLGIALSYSYPHGWRFYELVHLTGHAFAVAGVLGAVVEYFIVERLIDQTAKSLSHRLIGWGLPSELQGEIRKIVDTTLVRFNTLKRYRLQDPRDGKITVAISYSFDVRNYGDTPEEYAPWLSEEGFYDPQFDYLQYGIPGQQERSYEGQELTALVSERDGDRAREVGGQNSVNKLPRIRLQPYRSDPNQVCKVLWRYRLTMPESYTDTTSFGGATVGIRVEAEEVPDGFMFVGRGREAIRSGQTWTYTRPFIQNQHIRVRWFRESKR